uniref:Phorbol-ester/DAG-type domain-containing protein n=1 Tax=Anopheles minimus TaxID=112268 RepID=A0A182WMH2_9DIPT
MSSSSSSSMKTKWLKAFRSLKPAGSANDRKSGNGAQIRFDGTDNHNLQEYTYKKITPCDVCSQVLRGHTRQGLRCRICKVNVHADCASQLPKCQVKQKLLRRQKSTSEIENRATEVEEEKPTDVDQIYQVLKQAGEISSGKIVADPSKGPGATGTASVAAGPGHNQTVSNPPLDIPVVNVPEYPDRAPWRGPVKSQGPNYPHQKQGLTAPVATDMSCSDMRVPTNPNTHQAAAIDSGARRRLFAGFRPMSGFGILRLRSAQHRSISLPETEEDDIMISTRPFGQPLCFVVEEPPPEEMQVGKKDGKRKK